ncbi:O-antigen ligase [Arthrobacter sp. ISL-69]|uniref:O-antigen ligase family protein n=1 Tax=Arthrobacter sp. ISL-69 TaxID=2819113 RepID=UPI001BEAAFFB|nr:O-antigen ligase family protein [Arthrobacter sp. ISL-69]MBT2538269.1 O-antigen ligase family protein [Arthrobacter sp. ISL-69]
MKLFWAAAPVAAVLILALGLSGIGWGTAVLMVTTGLALLGALRSSRFAWAAFVASLTMSGLSIGLMGQNVLPEHVFLALLLTHALRKQPVTTVRSTLILGKEKYRPSLVLGVVLIVTWLLVTLIFSTFNSPSPNSSLRLLAWLCLNLIALFIVRGMLRDSVRMVSDALVTSVCVFGIYVCGWLVANVTGLTNVFVEADYASKTFRLKGLMLEPNLLAGLALLLLCVAFAYREAIGPRIFWIGACVLAFGIFITYTRAAWIVLFVVLAHAIWTAGIRHRLLVILGLGTAVVVIGLLISDMSMSAGSITDTILRRFDSLFDFDSGTGAYRFRTWEIAWQEIHMDGWFHGHGYNSFSQSHDALDTSDGTLYLSLLWLALVYDGGLLAFGLFTCAFLLIWANAKIGSNWFFIAFVIISTSTNPTWFMFPWVFAALLLPKVRNATVSTSPGSQVRYYLPAKEVAPVGVPTTPPLRSRP